MRLGFPKTIGEEKTMHFKFHIHIDDQEYLAFNRFHMFRSPYGKKQIVKIRWCFAAVFGALAFVSLIQQQFSFASWIGFFLYLLFGGLFQLLLKPIYMWSIKKHINALKKMGKPGYSPVSGIEFYDDYFIETTETNKTQQTYASLERVSVVDDQVIYLHPNSMLVYILPIRCFESKAQCEEFLAFMKTKCDKIERY